MTQLAFHHLTSASARCHLDSKFDTCVQAPICNSAAIHFSVIVESARNRCGLGVANTSIVLAPRLATRARFFDYEDEDDDEEEYAAVDNPR